MSNYDHTETFGLYAAILRKTDPSPFLPESDEEGAPAGAAPAVGAAVEADAVAPAGRRRPVPTAPPAASKRLARRRAPRCRRSRSISTDCSIAFSPCRAFRNVTYSNFKAGAAGMVYFLEAGGWRWRRSRRRGGGATLHRYSLRDRRDAPFVTGVADYDVSLDGHKLLYRGAGGGGGRGGRGGAAARGGGPPLFLVDADRNPPQAGQGRVDGRSARVRRSEAGVQADLRRSVAQPARLSLRAERARRGLAEGEADVQRVPAVRESSRRSELSHRHDGRRDLDRPLVRARRRHARRARRGSGRTARRRLRRSRTGATRSRRSTTTRSGIPICARRSRRRASTFASATTSSRSTGRI